MLGDIKLRQRGGPGANVVVSCLVGSHSTAKIIKPAAEAVERNRRIYSITIQRYQWIWGGEGGGRLRTVHILLHLTLLLANIP